MSYFNTVLQRYRNPRLLTSFAWPLPCVLSAPASKCDQHNRERTICCRDLKGDDERSLLDPDIVRDIMYVLRKGGAERVQPCAE